MQKTKFAIGYTKLVIRWAKPVLFVWLILLLLSVPFLIRLFDNLKVEWDPPKGTEAYDSKQLYDSEFGIKEPSGWLVLLRRNSGDSVLTMDSMNFTYLLVSRVTNSSHFKDKVESFAGYYLYLGRTDNETLNRTFLSEDRDTMFIRMAVWATLNDDDLVLELRQILREITPEGYTATVMSGPAIAYDSSHAVINDIKRIDIFVVPLIFVVLFLLLRNWKLVPLPMLTILFTVCLSLGLMGIISEFTVVSTFIPTIISALSMGIGVDYALFMLARFKEERDNGMSLEESIENMIAFAGVTILTSGMTLAVSFLGLVFFPLAILRTIGYSIAIVVFFSLLINLIFLPAFLGVFGRWILPYKPSSQSDEKPSTTRSKRESKDTNNRQAAKTSLWRKAGKFSVRFAIPIIITITILTVPVILQVIELKKSDELRDMLPGNTQTREAYDMLLEEFDEGMMSSVNIVVKTSGRDEIIKEEFYNQTLSYILLNAGDSCVNNATITSPFYMNGLPIPYQMYSLAFAFRKMNDTAKNFTLQSMDNATRAFFLKYIQQIEKYISQDEDSVRITFSLTSGPKSEKSYEWADRVRNIYRREAFGSNYTVGVYSQTTVSKDSLEQTYGLFPAMIVVVVVMIYIIIAVMYRSALVPLRLLLTIGLTLSFIYGAAVLFFEYHWGVFFLPEIEDVTGIYWLVPVLCFTLIVGLGLDYDLFIVSRIKEEVWKGKPLEAAIEDALHITGRIVTAAGAIMVISFGGLMLSTMLILVEVGFILAFAILMDTTVVRMLLVPAIMSVAKKWNWWPSYPPQVK
ncbi:MAG: MMPL family transporter [Thermoplasmata archaeon]